jgi:hypothetical protein
MAAPTNIAVTVLRDELARQEPDRDTQTVFVTVTGVAMIGEQITVQFIKARRNRDVSIAQKTLTLTEAGDFEYSLEFDLNLIVDSDDVPLARRGEYLMRATSVTDDSIVGESPIFLISLVTVHRLKNDFLFGTDQKAYDNLSLHRQPELITGVTVQEISRSHPQSWFPLAYNYLVDPNTAAITRTLSWCGGPTVTITTSKKIYSLRKGGSADYIDIYVPRVLNLPTEQVTEELLVERGPFDDTRMRQLLDEAISWIEDSELDIYLEPTRIVTEPNPTAITFEPGSDIPIFHLADWDEITEAVTYSTPRAGHWVNFKMPYRPLIRFDELFGQVSNVRILDVALEWVEISHAGGFVELVPFNQELAFNFIGLIWVESLRGPIPLPNFWNYNAIVGFRKTPPVLIEVVAKKAAMDILTIAGQAFRGGFSSQSISRDGVSESVSYTASAIYGIYSATIEDYRKFIEANLKKFRSAFHGSAMVVV